MWNFSFLLWHKVASCVFFSWNGWNSAKSVSYEWADDVTSTCGTRTKRLLGYMICPSKTQRVKLAVSLYFTDTQRICAFLKGWINFNPFIVPWIDYMQRLVDWLIGQKVNPKFTMAVSLSPLRHLPLRFILRSQNNIPHFMRIHLEFKKPQFIVPIGAECIIHDRLARTVTARLGLQAGSVALRWHYSRGSPSIPAIVFLPSSRVMTISASDTSAHGKRNAIKCYMQWNARQVEVDPLVGPSYRIRLIVWHTV